MKAVFNLVDDNFAHDKFAVAGVISNHVIWDRTLSDQNIPTFYSHHRMGNIRGRVGNNKAYGFIFESRGIVGGLFEALQELFPLFDKVFLHHSELLKKHPNCFWIPGGGIWIGGTFGKGEIKIFEKSKLCSMVSSTKEMCPLHILRKNIAIELLNNPTVDIFGLNNWVPINQTLEDYMFSICVENYQDDLYFTEKILNCFATGTIPIYLGAKNIEEKFNLDGILKFNTKEELYEILPKLSKDLYMSKYEAVKDNFERCLQYRCLEDYIYLNYFK